MMIQINDHDICINNYKQLQSIDHHQMIVSMNKYQLFIKGHDLKIHYYDCYEIRIIGELHEILFRF